MNKVNLMKIIRWNSPENTKPKTSRWHRKHTKLSQWFFRWYIELTIPGPLPEINFNIAEMMQTIEVPKLVFRIPES